MKTFICRIEKLERSTNVDERPWVRLITPLANASQNEHDVFNAQEAAAIAAGNNVIVRIIVQPGMTA
jgi:hypothetical protein